MLPAFALHSTAMTTLIEAGGNDYLLTALHTGQTYRDIAAGLGITRRTILAWIRQQSDDVQAELDAATLTGVAAMMEDTVAIADNAANEVRSMDGIEAPVILAAEKTRIAVRQHYAERKDKENWGPRPTTEITITQNTLHLDALRRCYDPAYERPVAVVPDSAQPAIPAPPSMRPDLW